MNKKVKYIIYIVIFILVIMGLNIAYEILVKKQSMKMENMTQQETEKRTAMNFTVYDKENNPIQLSDFKGKPIVINFWASWCGPCKQELPDFEKVYQQEKENVIFMMVNATDGINDTKKAADALIQSKSYQFPVYYDLEAQGLTAYRITGFPTTVFIDKEFNIVSIYQTMLTEQNLMKYINKIK